MTGTPAADIIAFDVLNHSKLCVNIFDKITLQFKEENIIQKISRIFVFWIIFTF